MCSDKNKKEYINLSEAELKIKKISSFNNKLKDNITFWMLHGFCLL